MTDKRNDELMYLLGACGSALHLALKTESGKGLIPRYAISVPHPWDHPPMIVKGDLFGFSMANVPDLVMGHMVDDVDVEDVWLRCCAVMCDRPNDLPAFVANMFHGLPQNGMKPVDVMARVLALLSFKGGKVSFPSCQMLLNVGGALYGLTNRSVIAPGANRRLKREVSMDSWSAMNVVGEPREADTKFRDVEAHVSRHLPRLLKLVRILIGAAAHRGDAYASHLLECFEFEDEVVEYGVSNHWDKARELVMASSDNPTIQLYDLLKPVIGSVLFIKNFGNPHASLARIYTKHLRMKHGAAIDKLDGVRYERREGKVVDEAAAHALLKFQQQMGMR